MSVKISPIDPTTFEYQNYSQVDNQLILTTIEDTSFDANFDYIEYYIYDQQQNLLFPTTTVPLLNYDIRNGDILINPENDLINAGFNLSTYNIIYSFYRRRLASNLTQKYYISEISSDRKEIRLDSTVIDPELIISSSEAFIDYREESEYFVDFYLNFGENQTVIANNLRLDLNEGIDPTILVKLYEPLPSNFSLKNELWVVEELSSPQGYQVSFPFEPIIEDNLVYLSGPNYNLNITQESSVGGEIFSFNTLLQSDVTSSVNQIKSLLNEKEINININYENYSNFVNFSSAQTRLENFVYKVELLESASLQLKSFITPITSDTTASFSYSSSKAVIQNQIDDIIKNFDGYEYFLYFNSGSLYSYPKVNSEPPFILAPSTSTQALEWVGNSVVGSTYYGGQALSASNYDEDNRDRLFYSIPEYLREDPQNKGYELFVDMVGQYYDNVWVYTKDISNKFNADNRLEFGISKDLVADAIRDFAVKLYSNNFNTDDLYTAFLGLTPSGSLFPFPNMTGSLPTETGFEYVNTQISASNDVVPLNDVQKQVYKRIYHNIPYLLKTKGTVTGLRALITSYGIPDTILRINEFGGKDRNEAHDYDLKQHNFNFAYDTTPDANRLVSSSFEVNSKWEDYNDGNSTPLCVQFRFKTAGIPTASNNIASSDIRYSQSLWMAKRADSTTGSLLVLEYTGSGFTSASFSGSVPSIYDNYGTLKFIPAANANPTLSASIYLPFFDGNWWSVQLNHTGSQSDGSDATGSLFAANQINGVIGFTGSSETLGYDPRSWTRNDTAFLNTSSNVGFGGKFYQPFSGALQEYRFWNQEISQSNFYDYTANPFSIEGNGVDSTPDQLIFRADLGTQLNTASRTSIHPRITGSAVQITQSFANNSNFFANGPYVVNREHVYQDQVPAGIKNRITEKIHSENVILAESPYGYETSTSTLPNSSSNTSDVISPIESIQQISYVSQSYTPNVNYLEVSFSPTNQINDDINAQLGYFNLGDYIGDPRQISSSSYTYPDLDVLRDAYFEKYIRGYNIADFVRLIKFFDNSLFKMIQDFTPARTSLASGVVVKQHILERNRLRPAQVTSSFHQYSGSVKPFPKDYHTGSSDQPQYATSGSSIYKFTGGPGGSFNRYNGLKSYFFAINNLSGSLNHLQFTSSMVNEFVGVTSDDEDFFGATLVTDCCGNFPIQVASFVANSAGFPADDIANLVVNGGTFPGVVSGSTPNYKVGDSIIIDGTTVGGTGGFFQAFITQEMLITTASSTPSNQFLLTQSWSESFDNSVINTTFFNQSSSQYISASYLGPKFTIHDDQSEFYDGQFSGSLVTVTTQSIGKCTPYLSINDDAINFKPFFFSLPSGIDSVISRDEFYNQRNYPRSGQAWIASQITNQGRTGIQQVVAIKLNQSDVNGVEVIEYLDDESTLRILLPDAAVPFDLSYTEYVITSKVIYDEFVLLNISTAEGINGNNYFKVVDGTEFFPITSSAANKGAMNWGLDARTDFTRPTRNADGTIGGGDLIGNDLNNQNVFLDITTLAQEQMIQNWNGSKAFATDRGFEFDIGGSGNSKSGANVIPNGSATFTSAAYTIDYTPNVPYFITASLKYSSSFDPNASTAVTASGIYHSSSKHSGPGLTNQNFTIGPGLSTTSYAYYLRTNSGNGFASEAAAESEGISNAPDSGDNDLTVYADEPFMINGTSLFTDPALTVAVTEDEMANGNMLSGDIFYVGSKDGSSYFTFSLTEGTRVVANLNQQGFGKGATAGTAGSVAETNASFFPSPAIVDLPSSQVFIESYNTQIPGNSGSLAGLTGGHPKLNMGSTASLDFFFPSFKLAGTPPTTASSIPVYVALSGSDFGGSNDDFQSYNDNISGYFPGAGYSASLSSTNAHDGFFGFTLDQIDNDMALYAETVSGFSVPANSNYIRAVRFKSVDFTVRSQNAGENFTASLFVKRENVKSESNTLINVSGSLQKANTSGIASLFNYVNDDALTIYAPDTSTSSPAVYDASDPCAAFIGIKIEAPNDFNYYITDFTAKVDVLTYTTQGGGVGGSITTVSWPGGLSPAQDVLRFDAYKGSVSNLQPYVAQTTPSGDRYNTGIIDVFLKVTGSWGERTITSSVFSAASSSDGYSGSIYDGLELSFASSPILDIFDNDPTSANHTINSASDMYFVEYSMSNVVGGVLQGIQQQEQTFEFEDNSDRSTIFITSSGGLTGTGLDTFNVTGSVVLRKTNIYEPTSQNNPITVADAGDLIVQMPFYPLANQTNKLAVISASFYNGDFKAGDVFRWTVKVDKFNLGSGLVIREFSSSIYNSASIWAGTVLEPPTSIAFGGQPTDTGIIISTYFGANILPFSLALDCQPLLNNFNAQRDSSFLMRVDYNNESGPIIPVNQEQILANTAVKAAIPDSNYTATSSIIPRYVGSKSTSRLLNVWSIGDEGTYGKNPTVELRNAFFGYFNDLSDPYPNINGVTRVNLNYLIDEQGNALPPSLEALSIDTFKAVFPEETSAKLALKQGKEQFVGTNELLKIQKIMKYYSPIMYSQNSGDNYTNTIPLSGSGYISRYDNQDSQNIRFYRCKGEGETTANTSQPVTTVDYWLNPAITSSAAGSQLVYSGSNYAGTGITGSIQITDSDFVSDQVISFQHSFVTTAINERGGRDELRVQLRMYTGSTLNTVAPFNLEGIDAKIYTDIGGVTLLKDVDQYGWFDYELIEDPDINLNKGAIQNNYKYTRAVFKKGLQFSLDWEMYETMYDLGIIRETRPKQHLPIIGIEWIIRGNTGNRTLSTSDIIRWRLTGNFVDSSGGYQQGFFFPNTYTGAMTPTIIRVQGAADYLLDEANKAQAPFWVYTGSSANSGSNFLVMSSSNMNEAYGTSFRQGEIAYIPGSSQYFPGGIEPVGTNFGRIEDPLELQEGDEIRFGNNESFTYTITEVFAPSENISSSAGTPQVGQLKIRLDGVVPITVNKDFFLVRRPKVSANNLLLDYPFPYGVLASASISEGLVVGTGSFALTGSGALNNANADGYTGSFSELEIATTPGILYPSFPTEYLVQSASIIVNELISKGIIES